MFAPPIPAAFSLTPPEERPMKNIDLLKKGIVKCHKKKEP